MEYILSLVSIAIGVAGIAIALWQRHERIRLRQVFDNYIFRIMEQAQALTPYQKDMQRILEGTENHAVRQWACMQYKGISDLYRTSVDHFLSTRARFTFDDLHRLVMSGVIVTRWEESIWRASVGARIENFRKEPPPFFIKNDEARRHEYLDQAIPEQSSKDDAKNTTPQQEENLKTPA
ncbi:MAG: hypothetical protein PVH61_00100 [Candidatus Aminicenantes bacterium]|jgi:hypothetical protein